MSKELKVREVIADLLGVEIDTVQPDSHFIDDLGADSLDLVELMMAMEDKFGVSISDEEAEKMATVKDAINFVMAQ